MLEKCSTYVRWSKIFNMHVVCYVKFFIKQLHFPSEYVVLLCNSRFQPAWCYKRNYSRLNTHNTIRRIKFQVQSWSPEIVPTYTCVYNTRHEFVSMVCKRRQTKESLMQHQKLHNTQHPNNRPLLSNIIHVYPSKIYVIPFCKSVHLRINFSCFMIAR